MDGVSGWLIWCVGVVRAPGSHPHSPRCTPPAPMQERIQHALREPTPAQLAALEAAQLATLRGTRRVSGRGVCVGRVGGCSAAVRKGGWVGWGWRLTSASTSARVSLLSPLSS